MKYQKETLIISLFLTILITVGFTAISPPPKKFTLNEEQAGKLFQAIEISKKAIPTSTSISALEASTALNSLQEIQKVIGDQYKAQTDTVKPKK